MTTVSYINVMVDYQQWHEFNIHKTMTDYFNHKKETILNFLRNQKQGYYFRILGIANETRTDTELVRLLLKELKNEGLVKIGSTFSEYNAMITGSGYAAIK